MRKSVMSATTSNQSSKFIAEGVQEKLTNIKGYIAGTKHVGSTVLAAMAKQGMFHLVIISALMQAFSAENSTTLLPFWKIFQELRRLTQGRIFIEMLQLANHSADAEDWLLSVGDNLASLELSQIHHSVKALRSKLSTESKLLLGKAILHLYVPTARRLKLMSMVEQLEEAALEFIDPQGFQKVKSMVATAVEVIFLHSQLPNLIDTLYSSFPNFLYISFIHCARMGSWFWKIRCKLWRKLSRTYL